MNLPSLPESLIPLADRALARLERVTDTPFSPEFTKYLQHLAIISDFAIDTLCRQPVLLTWLMQADPPVLPPPILEAMQTDKWPSQLRRYRAAMSVRLIWRDMLGLDTIEATLTGSTELAQTCLQLALEALEADMAQRHGVVRRADGTPVRLIILGLGKLGGGELNFSSDIDLVYAFTDNGQSDGARPLMAETYFARLGQRLTRLLDESTAEGFCHRVDLRLRPFGNSGHLALSLAAMDQYFQREGRDWERYAWIKARPVAGDIQAGQRWLESLIPFVYRRYLDYTALDGLREMKAAIATEVARRDRLDDIKRGPGGIREIEFLAQCLQLIRGGRESVLRQRSLLRALRALVATGHMNSIHADTLAAAYRFERHLENRLQMRGDNQTHTLPSDPLERQCIATGLGYADWDALLQVLQKYRQQVSTEFDALLATRQQRSAVPEAWVDYWRTLSPVNESSDTLFAAGFTQAEQTNQVLRHFAHSPGVKALSDHSRIRLNRVLPALLHAASHTAQPDTALQRALGLLQAIVRRTSYLALLDEQPDALTRLVNVLAHSALLTERLQSFPVLLDELLDVRIAGPLPDTTTMQQACYQALNHADTETALRNLNETRLALSFRLALAFHDGRINAIDCTCRLAQLANAVVTVILQQAQLELIADHGLLPGGRFAVIAYGSLGALELGFGSDLDLIFLYDYSAENNTSHGPRPLIADRWFARLAQKIMARLSVNTAAGRLYEVDVRLRPDGAKGALVTSLTSYQHYQTQRAWTWEHQALVRARGIAGDASLLADFEQIRQCVLTTPRSHTALCKEVTDMRERMRNELDRSRLHWLDLKQGKGTMVDLGFVLQAGVLAQAADHPALCQYHQTPALITALSHSGWFPQSTATELLQAYATLLHAALHCTLDRRPRIVEPDVTINHACTTVIAAARACGLAITHD